MVFSNIPEVADHFNIESQIGAGTFGTVYVALLKNNPNKWYALKHIVPTCIPSRIENEIKCLSLMRNNECIISLETFVHHNDHIVLIMPFFKHDAFQDYITRVTITEVQQYMRALFMSLEVVHAYHIIHRDIKPTKFLYNYKEKTFKLIDFGLAQMKSGYKNEIFAASSISLPCKSQKLHQEVYFYLQKRQHYSDLKQIKYIITNKTN